MANLPRKEKTEVAAESTGHVEPTPAKTRLAAGPPPAGNAVLPAIPEHQLLRSVGRGSYGEVWLARNVMGTYRAVKVVYRKNFENDRPTSASSTASRNSSPFPARMTGWWISCKWDATMRQAISIM